MRMPLSRIERYATGKSPFVGIPVWDSTVDKLVTAVFLRSLLDAALEFAKAKGATVEYVSQADNVKGTKTYELVFNGTRAGSWRLVDLKQAGKMMPWDIKRLQENWASGRRKAAITRAKTAELGKDGVYVRRLREAVEKLEREKKKKYLYLSAPSNPVLERGRSHGEPGENYFDKTEWAWHEGKVLRKALAKVQGDRIADTLYGFLKTGRHAKRDSGTWAEFYARVAEVTGQGVDSSLRHDRVCARRHGPDRISYLKHLPEWIGVAKKPYRGWELGEVGKRIESYRESRAKYLDRVRAVKAIDWEIAQHRAEIASALENRGTSGPA